VSKQLTPQRAYAVQKARAARRGISFEFSFEEWMAWWEQQLGPDWLSKRGRLRHQFQMARYGDIGPYRIDNVKCITATQNLNETVDSPETRAKIGAAHKGRKRSAETRALMSAANKGRRHSPEARAKIGAAQVGNKNFVGHTHSPETRARIRAANKGRQPSEETRARMSAANIGNKHLLGHKHSPETRALIGAASRRRWEKVRQGLAERHARGEAA
jgi:hypothetical protein